MFKKKTVTAGAAPASAAPGPSRRRKVIAIGGMAMLVFAAAGTWVVLAMGAPESRQTEVEEMPRLDGASGVFDSAALPSGTDLMVMKFDEFIVNITAINAAGQGIARFMKLDLALVFDRSKDPEGLVETREIYMRDAFQDYLRQLTERDLDGTAGLVTIKSELLRRARAISGSSAPHEVLVLGLVLQ